MIKLAQRALNLFKLLLGLRNRGREQAQALLVIGLVPRPRLVLAGAVVLDLLARVLDFCEAQRRARAL